MKVKHPMFEQGVLSCVKDVRSTKQEMGK